MPERHRNLWLRLDHDGSAAEARLLQLLESGEAEDPMLARPAAPRAAPLSHDEANLGLIQKRLWLFSKYTPATALGRPLQSERALTAWHSTVDSLSTLEEATRALQTWLDATGDVRLTDEVEELRQEFRRSGGSFSLEQLRDWIESYHRCRHRRSEEEVAARRRQLAKRRREGQKEFERAVNDAVRRNDLLVNGGGFVTLNAGKIMSQQQLDSLREDGVVGLSPAEPHVLEVDGAGRPVSVAWATDELYVPPVHLNCVLWMLAALLGRSLSALGAATDPLVLLRPRLVDYGMVAAMLRRSRSIGAALGALSLPRVPNVTWEIIRRRAGVYLFTGLLLRGGRYHRHALGYNAGASLLYIGPWVVAISEADRARLDLFVATLELEFGVFLPAQCTCRQLVIDPRAATGLPLVSQSVSLGEERTRVKRRRGGRAKRAGKRARRAGADGCVEG